jgi:ankyrin repeat protein
VTDGEDAGVTPLLLVAWNDRLDILKLLIAAGADVTMARVDGLTPLHKAAENGHADVVSVLLEPIGVDLVAAMTDGEVVGYAGVTPLLLAAWNDRLDIVKLLIAAGADVTKACDDGLTPLHTAAENGHADVV